MHRRLALLTLLLVTPAVAQPQPPVVLAAASLQEALTAAVDDWARSGHPRPVVSFAASSALARQAAAGVGLRGGADLFFSADTEWMDYLDQRGLFAPGTRMNVLRNRLVVVARRDARVGRLNDRAAIARTLSAGPLAMADPDSVPAGKYGKAALTALGAWPAVSSRVVRAENVRAALALVERGAAPYAIVYATDARASRNVRVVGTFPAASHPPIVYPLARLKASRRVAAEGFRRFLVSARGRAVFARFGFGVR